MNVKEIIIREEGDEKPNIYSIQALKYTLFVIAIIELFNELGIYHVSLWNMRISAIVVFLCSGTVQLFRAFPTKLRDPKTKYIIMVLFIIEIATLSIFVTQWAELVLCLPVLLAIQYHNKYISRLAMISVGHIAMMSAPISVLLKIPEVAYYKFLLRSIGYNVVSTPIENFNVWSEMFNVIRYISLPRCLIVVAIGPIAYRVSKMLALNIDDRADATQMRDIDILTGLKSRYSYENVLTSFRKNRPASLICIYGDADSLHIINNEKGHSVGDTVLKMCATQMLSNYAEMTFRVGGDEFVSFVESEDFEDAKRRAESIEAALTEKGFHISLGLAALAEGQTIDELIAGAEGKMLEIKRKWYAEQNLPPRR